MPERSELSIEDIEELHREIAHLKQKVSDLEVLRKFAITLTEVKADTESLLWQIAAQVMGALWIEDCVIYLREGDWLHQRAAFGPKNPNGRIILHPIQIRVGDGVVGAAAATGKPQLVHDTRRDPRYILDDAQRLSELAVPLVVEGVVEGVLDSEHSQVGFYTPWHVDLFVALASMASARILGARLVGERLHLQEIDPVSRLLNRRTLLARADAARASGPVALLLLDIDGFGRMNDTLGHAQGDLLLREVGQRVAAGVGPAGFVGRIGADEFVVVTHPDAASPLAEHLRTAVAIPVDLPEDPGTCVTVSTGIAAGQDRSAEALLADADLALSEIRQSQPGEIAWFDPEAAERVRSRWRVSTALASTLALGSDAIDVHFQPICSLADGRLLGAEALARWTDPELGAVSPVLFISVAEDSGQMVELGLQLRAKLLAHLRDAPRIDRFRFHLNVSALEMRTQGFADGMLAQISAAGVPSECLAIELTESALLGAEGEASRNLRTLAAEGIWLVLDDFGTGYASLSSLTGNPFDGVKIDRQFVKGMMDQPQDAAVVRGVISLIRSMSLTVTAEGVETPEQAALLREMGCERAQGWAYGRPMPFARLAELLPPRGA